MLDITYLYHSGFAVRTGPYCFIFDYYLDTPRGCGFSKGVVDPKEIRDRGVFVFVSHRHPDHYNRRIFSWRKEIPHIHYLISDDIRTTEDVLKMHGGMTASIGNVTVQTLTSTDAGVAFVVRTGKLCLYHAGDLNWWHWEGEPERDNSEMAERYRRQIDMLQGQSIDVAFVPVDPRLGGQALWGLDYLMRTADVKYAVPMHFGDDTSIFDRIENDPLADGYRDRLLCLKTRGETRRLPL